MLGWAVGFFLVALAAAAFGFGGLAGTTSSIAQILFFLFVVLSVATLTFGRRPIR